MHYVIIGAGPAGVTAAEALRKLDNQCDISIIGDEPEPPYSRMALPYYLIKKIDESGTYLRTDDSHFQHHNIELIQQRVEKILPDQKTLCLADGDHLLYDKLLIATGSSPIKPAIPGIGLPEIYNCWTLDDARNICEHAKPGSRVVLMGAGFIGCIILEALFKSGANLTVVEMGNRMVPRMMNKKAGRLIQRWCENKGIKIHTDSKITSFAKGRDKLQVTLDNNQTLVADFVVCAAGVKTNTGFLEGSGINIDQGILIDRHMQTNIPDIYAAGDVAQGLDFSTGEYSVQAIQPTATDHGVLVALNMTGSKEALHRGNINMNVLDTLGLIACSFGLWMGVEHGDSAEQYNPDRFRYINLQFDGEYLVGATAIGLTQHVGVLRGLIQSKVKLGAWKERLLHEPLRIMEAYLSCTQAIGLNTEIM
jgi:NAD(P)H-nitrite reductase large subunit